MTHRFSLLGLPATRPFRRVPAGKAVHAGTVTDYSFEQPSRADVDATSGPLVVAFGTDWCGYCRSAERHIGPAMAEHPDVRLLAVEDGPGRPLGRSYRVKLWPTLIFLRDGVEMDRVVRPTKRGPIDEALAKITAPA